MSKIVNLSFKCDLPLLLQCRLWPCTPNERNTSPPSYLCCRVLGKPCHRLSQQQSERQMWITLEVIIIRQQSKLVGVFIQSHLVDLKRAVTWSECYLDGPDYAVGELQSGHGGWGSEGAGTVLEPSDDPALLPVLLSRQPASQTRPLKPCRAQNTGTVRTCTHLPISVGIDDDHDTTPLQRSQPLGSTKLAFLYYY